MSDDVNLLEVDFSKKPKLFRLTQLTIRKLKEAAIRAGRSESIYVEDALKAQFKREGIS